MRNILVYILLYISFVSYSQLVTYYPNKRIFTGTLEVITNATFDFKGTEVDSLIVDGDTLRMYIDGIQFKAIVNPNVEIDPIYNVEKDSILFENDTILVLATKSDIQNLQNQIDTLPTLSDVDTALLNVKTYADNIVGDTTEYDPVFQASVAAGISASDTNSYRETIDSLHNHANKSVLDGILIGGNPVLTNVTAPDTTRWAHSYAESGLTNNDTVYFTKISRIYNNDTITTNRVLKVKSTGKIAGSYEYKTFVGDGSHGYTFTGATKATNSLDYDYTLNVRQLVTFFYTGSIVIYWITQY